MAQVHFHLLINHLPIIGSLLAALVSFGLVGYTGYLGGQIRHTELNNGAASGSNEAGGAAAASGDND